MNCQEVKEVCSDYLDRRLAPMRMVSIQEHLRICPDCSQEMEELSKTVFLIRSLEEIEPSHDFLSRVHRKITRGREKKRSAWARLFEPIRIKVPLQVTALLFVGVIGLYLYHRSPEPTRESGERPTDTLSAGRDTTQPPATPERKKPTGGYETARQEPDARAKEEKQLSKPGSVEALKEARVEAGIPAPRPQVVELLVEDVAAHERRVNLLLERLGGKLLVQEGSSASGLLLTVEVPQPRRGEFLAAVTAEREEKDKSISRSRSQEAAQVGKDPALESSARTDDSMVRLHLRILPKK
ncbi:MAG: zf-HC2 domain-containing protein [Candidatus Binatia bacterium]